MSAFSFSFWNAQAGMIQKRMGGYRLCVASCFRRTRGKRCKSSLARHVQNNFKQGTATSAPAFSGWLAHSLS